MKLEVSILKIRVLGATVLSIFFYLTYSQSSFSQKLNNPNLSLSPVVKSYLEEILDAMQKNAVNRSKIDWEFLRKIVYEKCSDAKQTFETYKVIKEILPLLLENHSVFLTPQDILLLKENTEKIDFRVKVRSIEAGIGYIFIPNYSSLSESDIQIYSEQVQKMIQSVDAKGVSKWVVDLRENTGGNMWPMIQGLGPLLGQDCLGFFIDPQGEKIGWHYINRRQKNRAQYELKNPIQGIAVLIGPKTASSGEAIAISFIGNSDTRTFGQKSSGYTTCNSLYTFKDGSGLLLATGYFADRNENIYYDGITPDEIVNTEDEEGVDLVLNKALHWLRSLTSDFK